MDLSTDEKHKATLDLLLEVADYLDHLPRVPATRHLATRLRQHVEEPPQRHLVRATRELFGEGPFLTSGVPVLQASFADDVVTLNLVPKLAPKEQSTVLKWLVDTLKTGGKVSLHLTPRLHAPDLQWPRR